MEQIYLDYAATTPVAPQIFEAMAPYFTEIYGNPSSIHRFGQISEGAVEDAREKIAQKLNAKSKEIVFTSCGTESNNLAIRGVSLAAKKSRGANHILTSAVEHPAVSKTVDQLRTEHHFDVEFIPVDKFGMVTPEDVQNRIRKNTAIVSIIYANNEIGTINPISGIGEVCKQAGVPFHTDAMQAAAYLSLDVQELNVDLLTLGGHKIYGPKGVGALYLNKQLDIIPTQTGGSQEQGLRGGTLNVPLIVGMAEALNFVQNNRAKFSNKLTRLRDLIISEVISNIPDTQLTGHPEFRMPNHASFVFKNVDGNGLLVQLDAAGFACSSGSACKTGAPEPSSVISALGFSRDWGLGSLRVTLGMHTTYDQIKLFLEKLPDLIKINRELRQH